MARAKRFYLCNLIPLCEIDDDHLAVDWTQEDAKNGEIVEMRVVVKDLNLNMKTPDFAIEFEINENDLLLFGGLDDHVVTITSKNEKDKDHRPLLVIGEKDPVPAGDRLKNIFVSPLPNKAPQKLIRAFWLAAWQDDVAGSPEYYFDVKLEFTGKAFKERSDRELTVSKDGIGQGGGAGGALVLPAVGWSLEKTFAEQAVAQLALLDQPNVGKPVSFVITPDDNASLLWILLIPARNDVAPGGALLKNSWTVPRFLPLENIRTLSLKANISGKEVKASTVAKPEAEKFKGQSGGLFAELTLDVGRATTTPPDPSITLNEQQLKANALLSADATLIALKKTLDKELASWAKTNKKTITPTDRAYAATLQEFAFQITHGSDSLILPRPKSASALTKWKDAFQKSYLLALMIMSSGSAVDRREEETANIAADLAQANFVTEALNVVNLFSSREQQEFTFENILKNATPTAAQWTTVLNFFTAGTGTLREAEVHETFGFLKKVGGDRLFPSSTRPFIAKLGTSDSDRTSKLDAISTALISAYANDPDLVWVLSGFLFMNLPFRQPFSDKMWRTNQSYLLFKILMCEDFIEPQYQGQQKHEGVELTMARDMTWVYQNKQRLGVDFLVALCDRAGTAIPRPTNLNFNPLRSWLEAQTETIAAAGPKVYSEQKDWFDLYNLVTDFYFFHVDRFDVIPDLHGHIGTLGPADPSGLRIRADCDVFATYGARFMRAMGFTSIGYMGIMPAADPIGHAGALLKKDERYFVVNNKRVLRVAATTESEALVKLRDEILDILNNPKNYRVYYAPADSTGGMSVRIREQGNEVRRTDLE
jgi:hypothetical protein